MAGITSLWLLALLTEGIVLASMPELFSPLLPGKAATQADLAPVESAPLLLIPLN